VSFEAFGRGASRKAAETRSGVTLGSLSVLVLVANFLRTVHVFIKPCDRAIHCIIGHLNWDASRRDSMLPLHRTCPFYLWILTGWVADFAPILRIFPFTLLTDRLAIAPDEDSCPFIAIRVARMQFEVCEVIWRRFTTPGRRYLPFGVIDQRNVCCGSEINALTLLRDSDFSAYVHVRYYVSTLTLFTRFSAAPALSLSAICLRFDLLAD
jgi:hypothetical protein